MYTDTIITSLDYTRQIDAGRRTLALLDNGKSVQRVNSATREEKLCKTNINIFQKNKFAWTLHELVGRTEWPN